MTVASPLVEVEAALLDSLQRIREISRAAPAAKPLVRLLQRLHRTVVAPPRVVLLGEFNSGKSTLANALIGAEALPTSIYANTRVPLHARYAQQPSLTAEILGGERIAFSDRALVMLQEGRVSMLHVGIAAERLKTFELIDTPGLSPGSSAALGIVERHALAACRRAHIAIWCTAATQAWKASEAQMWSLLPERLRRRSLLVVTLVDALNTERDRLRVEERLRSEAGPSFGGVVLVSAAEVEVLRSGSTEPDHAERWVASGGAALDQSLHDLIDQEVAGRAKSVARVLERIAGKK